MSAGVDLDRAWHRDSALSSLERWRQVCAQEGWGEVPRRQDRLAAVFGASWYFTRFLFFRGLDAARLIDDPLPPEPWDRYAGAHLRAAAAAAEAGGDPLDTVRVGRNEVMLRALVAWLDGDLDQPQLEAVLTTVAETVVELLMERFVYSEPALHAAVLGMGRLAGAEMNFGSDLDLIFLYEDREGDGQRVGRGVRALLRNVAAASACGSLYDVDIRLRPHGRGGALVTTAASFREYHAAAREVWERQMMTRCRPISDPFGVGAAAVREVRPFIYGTFDHGLLRREIRDMRMRVERELGRPQGRFELKRGHGGIMDLDFISHYLQLAHGRAQPVLQSCSTRVVLRQAAELQLLAPDVAADLLRGYEYLKRVETCLRLFDVKSVSTFAREAEAMGPLARAMGLGEDAVAFEAQFRGVTDVVRDRFEEVLHVPPKDAPGMR